MEDLASLGIPSLYGPDHEENTAAYCDLTKIEVVDLECTEECVPTYIDSPACDYFQSFNCGPGGEEGECVEIGVKYLDSIVQ